VYINIYNFIRHIGSHRKKVNKYKDTLYVFVLHFFVFVLYGYHVMVNKVR